MPDAVVGPAGTVEALCQATVGSREIFPARPGGSPRPSFPGGAAPGASAAQCSCCCRRRRSCASAAALGARALLCPPCCQCRAPLYGPASQPLSCPSRPFHRSSCCCPRGLQILGPRRLPPARRLQQQQWGQKVATAGPGSRPSGLRGAGGGDDRRPRAWRGRDCNASGTQHHAPHAATAATPLIVPGMHRLVPRLRREAGRDLGMLRGLASCGGASSCLAALSPWCSPRCSRTAASRRWSSRASEGRPAAGARRSPSTHYHATGSHISAVRQGLVNGVATGGVVVGGGRPLGGLACSMGLVGCGGVDLGSQQQ
jgi:hypothetical protein